MKANAILIVALLAAGTQGVQAADVITPTVNNILGDSSRVVDLDEVLVVTQPKEIYRLRQQPVSASMMSGSTMQALNVTDLRGLSAYVPSFTMPSYGSRITSSMYVRGIGSRINSPAVGIYVDGMPIMSKAAFNFHTYEVARVDVLRGPQGTLYGQNTEGGIVRLYSKNPMSYQGTDLRLSLGTHMQRTAELAHYAKLSDRLALSVAGFYNGSNGFFRNSVTGKRADDFNEGGGKMRLVWNLPQGWQMNLLADYQYVRQNGFPYGLVDAQTGTTAAPATNFQGNYRRNIFNTALSLTHHAEAFDFNSTTSYQYLKDYMLMDQDYLPQDFMHLEQRQFQNALTQEFSLKGNRAVGGFWRWTAGAFFSAQWLKTNAPIYFGGEMNKMLSRQITNFAYTGMLNAMSARMIQQGMAREAALAQVEKMIQRAGGCNIDMQMLTVPGLFRTPTFNLGFYHESSFDITQRLRATVGLRYDWSHVKIDYRTMGAAVLKEDVMGIHVDAKVISQIADRPHDNFDQLLPKLALSYRLDGLGSNVYATVSKGYRAGGFNMQMFSDILQTELSAAAQKARGEMQIEHDGTFYDNVEKTIAYKPETSWNYEVGTHLNLFDGAVHFDLAAFYMQVRNQQVSKMAGNYGFGRMMTNAGRSMSCGIEATLQGNAFDNNLTWQLSYGYTHAVFREYTDTLSARMGGKTIDYRNNRVPYVPEHTFAAMADYRFPIAAGALQAITLGANMCGQGKVYWDEANTMAQKVYALLGAHAEADFGAIRLNLWARNITGTKANTFAVQSAAAGQPMTFAQQGNPFQAGFDLSLHF